MEHSACSRAEVADVLDAYFSERDAAHTIGAEAQQISAWCTEEPYEPS